MPTTTFNGETFEVSSEPIPSRRIAGKAQYGKARLLYTAASPYETKIQDFEEAILGWSRVDPGHADRLNRYFPLCWPLHNQGTMNALEMNLASANRTANPANYTPTGGINPSTVNNPSTDSYWPTAPFNMYDVDFGPLAYQRFMTDTEAYAGPTPPRELGRFVNVREIAVPREYRRPDYGFVTDEATPREVLTVGFVPFIQAEVEYKWFQVPYPDSVPFLTIEADYLHVNLTDFDDEYSSFLYPAGTLLFTRMGGGGVDDWYYGPGGHKYVDLIYNFTYNPFGWNKYLKPDGTTVSMKRKNVTPATPPYASAEFDALFDPSSI